MFHSGKDRSTRQNIVRNSLLAVCCNCTLHNERQCAVVNTVLLVLLNYEVHLSLADEQADKHLFILDIYIVGNAVTFVRLVKLLIFHKSSVFSLSQ